MTEPKIGDWVVVTRGDPSDPLEGPAIGVLLRLDPGCPEKLPYCVSYRNPDGWWVQAIRLATPEEISAGQLASLESGL